MNRLGLSALMVIGAALVNSVLVYIALTIRTRLKRRITYAYAAYRKGVRIAQGGSDHGIIDGWYEQAARRRHLDGDRIKARNVIAAYERTMTRRAGPIEWPVYAQGTGDRIGTMHGTIGADGWIRLGTWTREDTPKKTNDNRVVS